MKKYLIAIVATIATISLYGQTETSGSEVYRATPSKYTELKHTKLKVCFDFDKKTLDGEAWVTASPYFYANDSVRLNAKSMQIHKVELVKGKKTQSVKYIYENDFINIFLDKKYNKNEDYTLYIKYTAQPELIDNKGTVAITDTKGLYFINPTGEDYEKPTQIWTQGETESSSVWFPTIDRPNQKTTQEIYITVPDKYVTLSNGILTSSVKEANGLRTDYWVMDKKHAPYLFFMAVGEFQVVKDTAWRGKVAVDYYMEKDKGHLGKKIFGNTSEMIEFFSKKYGYDFPWQKYAQVIVRDFVSGAMENTTAVSFSEYFNQTETELADENRAENTIAHELAHHWFGDLVTTESWANLTMNESFANYAEYLWLEYKYGKDVADYHLLENNMYYHREPDDFSKNLVRFAYEDKEDMFDKVSYNKGGAILHMLRDYLGDDAFFQGIAIYLKENEYSTGEAHQFRLALEKVSGKDLNWFFNQWYFSNGNPVIKISEKYDTQAKKIELKLSQIQEEAPLFQFPLEVDIYQNGKKVRHSVWVDAKKENIFTFDADKAPQLVDINPRGVILLSQEETNKTKEQYQFQYRHAKDYKSRNEALEYAIQNLDKQTIFQATSDVFFRLRIKALSALESEKLTIKELVEIEKIAKSDPENLARANAIKLLALSANKKYIPIYEQGVKTNSAAIKSASILSLSKIDPEKCVQLLQDTKANELKEEDLMELLPLLIDNKISHHLQTISYSFILYPFVEQSDYNKAKYFKEGFKWSMNQDDISSIRKSSILLKQIYSQIAQYPVAKNAINKVIEEAIDIKKELLNKSERTTTIKQQIEILERLQNQFK
ncbi:M1 family metallopeptidase [Capnocytophaga catalasegens]|nr:M1 family aminopeptidase [Capnocytophaga catalasegens]